MGWLSNKFDELKADVNMFDGGRTGKTVRASRPAPPATLPGRVNTMAPEAAEKIRNAKYGVLAGNKARQNSFMQSTQVPKFNPVRQIIPELKRATMPVLTGTGLRGARVAGDVVQAASGVVDLVSPGTGTSRVSKASERFNKNVDDTAKNLGGGVATAYKTTAPGITGLSYYAPTKLLQAATTPMKAAQTVKKGQQAVNFANRTLSAIEKVTTKLVEGNAGQRIVGAGLKNFATPGMAANVAAGTMGDLGRQSGKGEDISKQDVALSLGMNVGGGALLSAAPQAAVEGVRAVEPTTKLVASNAVKGAKAVDKTFKTSGSKVSFNQGVDSSIAQETKRLTRLKQDQAKLPVGDIGVEKYAREIVKSNGRIVELQGSKQKLSIKDRLLTAQPGMSMKAVHSPDLKPINVPKESVPVKKALPGKTTMSIPEDAPGSGVANRGYGQTINKDIDTDATVKQAVEALSYKIRNTADLQTRAANLIKDDIQTAIRVAQTDLTDVGVMLSNQLVPQLSRNGQPDLAIELAKRTAQILTKSGQTSQAASAYGKLAPEGVLRFTQNVVKEYNEANGFKAGKELILTPEKAQSIMNKSEALQDMPDGKAKDVATKQMLREIKEIVPSSWQAKVASVQTIGQLLNPKTFIRNIAGNGGFGGVLENASQVVAAGVDKGISLATKQRGVALPNIKTQATSFVKGGKQQIQELSAGVNLGPDTQFDLGDVPVFRSGAMAKVEKALGYTLRVPDRAAYTAAFDDTVKGLMKANKLDKPTQEILEQANLQGLYRTFQDDSKAAQLFVGLKGALNVIGSTGKDGKRFGLGDFILKYPKTPGNILDRGLDYSPAGIVKAIVKVATNAQQGKPFDQAALSNAIGRATVGSAGLVGTGAVLGALGIITEKPSKDVDERNLQKASGLGGYQINTSALRRFVLAGFNKDAAKLQKGDTLQSYDWAQPASIPLSAGAALGKGKSAKDGATNSLSGFADGLNSLVEQPLVTGIGTFTNNMKNKGISGAFGETIKGAPSTFIPTAINQVKQLTDNTARNTDDESMAKGALNKVVNRLPFASKSLPSQVDPLGRDKQVYQNNGNNPYNVLLNPSFTTKYDPKGSAELPLSINKSTGEVKQYPRTAPKKVQINDKSVTLTAKQQQSYQRFAGTATDKAFAELNGNPKFKSLNDTDKAKVLSSQLTDINAAAKVHVFGGTNDISKKANAILGGKTVTAKVEASNTDGSSTGIDVNDATTSYTKKVLNEYNDLDAETKKSKAYKENSYDFKVAQAKYDNDKVSGKLSTVQDINRKQAVEKAKVGKDYSKDIREAYSGLTKDEVYAYASTDPDGNRIVKQLLEYGDKLADATGEKNKFRNKNGSVNIAAKSSGGSGSGRRGRRRTSRTDFSLYDSANSTVKLNKSLRDLVAKARLA